MLRQIRIHGVPVELRSADGGRSWWSSPTLLVRHKRRMEVIRESLELTPVERSLLENFPGDPEDYHPTCNGLDKSLRGEFP